MSGILVYIAPCLLVIGLLTVIARTSNKPEREIRNFADEIEINSDETAQLTFKTTIRPLETKLNTPEPSIESGKSVDINYVREKCEIHKNHSQVLASNEAKLNWDAASHDQKQAVKVIMKYPYKQLRYFPDRRTDVDIKKNAIFCLPPKTGSSSWEVQN